MDEGRLGVVRRHEGYRRKGVYVYNEMTRSRWNTLNAHLTKEKYDSAVKFEKSTIMVRRAIVRQRVLQQCMKMKKQSVLKSNDSMLGCYGGKPLHAFARDIDKTIAYMHPRLRRLRKVDEQIRDSLRLGKIITEDEIVRRVKHYLDTNWKDSEEKRKSKRLPLDDSLGKKDIFSRHRNHIPPIRGLVNPFYKFINEEEEQKNTSDNQLSFDKLSLADAQPKTHPVKSEHEEDISNHHKVEKLDSDDSKRAKGVSSPERSNKILPSIPEKPVTDDSVIKVIDRQNHSPEMLERKRSIILPPITMTKKMMGK